MLVGRFLNFSKKNLVNLIKTEFVYNGFTVVDNRSYLQYNHRIE